MIQSKDFYTLLKNNGINFFCGVPDTILKDLINFLCDTCNEDEHIISSNEGNAVGLATGYHLATSRTPLVYMQNSGIGNTVNPLLSLAHRSVYSIPLLLLIGWRGHPQKKDQIQHQKQGEITLELMNIMDIDHCILSDDPEKIRTQITYAADHTKTYSKPYALIVPKNTFEAYKRKDNTSKDIKQTLLSREHAIQTIAQTIQRSDIIVSTTGKASRELFEYRSATDNAFEKDFLNVGAMGHCSQIAYGISLFQKKRNVFCIDGDGSCLMHMGSMATIGEHDADNFIHVLLNNRSHESVGGQHTTAEKLDFHAVAKACGYKTCFQINTAEMINNIISNINTYPKPVFIEIQITKDSRSDLGRPSIKRKAHKKMFMDFLNT